MSTSRTPYDRGTTVLELNNAVFDTGLFAGTGGVTMDLTLSRGELAMLWVDNDSMAGALADALTGIVRPAAGHVAFRERNWDELEPHETDRQRARIGRTFRVGAWLADRDLVDNILLPQMHHSRRPVEDLLDDAQALAHGFGLPGVPSGALRSAASATLARAACIRALLGQPQLIVLEAPTEFADEALSGQLVGALRASRDRGAAVAWITHSERVWYDAALPVDQRFRLTAHALSPVDVENALRESA